MVLHLHFTVRKTRNKAGCPAGECTGYSSRRTPESYTVPWLRSFNDPIGSPYRTTGLRWQRVETVRGPVVKTKAHPKNPTCNTGPWGTQLFRTPCLRLCDFFLSAWGLQCER